MQVINTINVREFIVNVGKAKLKGRIVGPRDLDNLHVDGDTFIHHLDSPNQSLLVIPCIIDVLENGGAQGVTPYMARCGEETKGHDLERLCD
ncbi:hypothetical protein ACQKWADRAFT_313999 [Trichoderma austrokoningii]